MKKVITLSLLCFLFFQLQAQQSSVNHWETIFHFDAEFKYQTNNTPVTDLNWRNSDFDDSGWNVGQGGFGYGDNDDNTIINNITSVFFRKQFSIAYKSEIAAAILNMDYDDAFVAYLNGVEIARSGGLNDAFPGYNVLSTQQHDAVLPEGGTPQNIIIDKDVLQTNLQEGINTLAIQVHNASSNSSDLSSNTWFSVGLNVESARYSTPPTWFVAPWTNFSSNLPIMVINTENGSPIYDEPKTTAEMGIIYNGPGERNHSNDPYNDYDGFIGIEVRGNSTSGFPKKPYNFETRDELGENRNVSLLGMPKENDWVLRASYLDHTFIRNGLADFMARQTGYWAARTRHVEVILNDEYQGIYLLMEKIKRDDDRVDIATINPEDIEGDELTGGYIWEVTGFENDFGENRKLKEPDMDDIQPEQFIYIQTFDNAFRDKMRKSSKVYANPNTGYVEHIWTESFIYELMIQEAMRNSDAYGWSGYYHKDKNELINAGPVWDFDQSSGNSSYPDNGVVEGWLAQHPGTSNTPFYWPLLLNESFFKYSLSLRWKALRSDKFETKNLFHHVDSIASFLSEAQEREFNKWPVLGKSIWRETAGYKERDTYLKEVNYLKDFLSQRWNWIDAQLANVPKPAGYPEITIKNELTNITENIDENKIHLDLNEVFSFPYSPKLKYSAYSSDTSIVKTDVKKSDSLKLKLNNIGTSDIFITATDTYGNKKNTSFTVEVVSQPNTIADITDQKNRLRIYPNPASNYINLQFLGKSLTAVNIQLYSFTGQHIDQVYQGANTGDIYYNCAHLENGIYLIQMKTESGKVFTQKLMVKD